MLTRHPDWQARLSQHLTMWDVCQFSYGVFDCGMFVSNAILAMTGTDIGEHFRGCYDSRKEAFAMIRLHCGTASVADLASKVAALHQMPVVPVTFAQRGDMLLLPQGKGHCLGLLDLDGQRALSPGRHGLSSAPVAHAIRAWRV